MIIADEADWQKFFGAWKKMNEKISNSPSASGGEVIVHGDGSVTENRWQFHPSIKDRVHAILAKISGVEITDTTTLNRDGLDLDSLDKIQVAVDLEEAFSIEIPDDDVDDPRLGTAAGIVAYVEGRVASQSPLQQMADQAIGFSSIHTQMRMSMARNMEELPDGRIRFKRRDPFPDVSE